MSYRVFVRTWWKEDEHGHLEPNLHGRKTTIEKRVSTEDEARRIAQEYNKTHNPGRLSRKAEYEEV